MNNPPTCDRNPEHGAMQIEPMYGNLEMTIILQHGWFCQVKDCDGYGGPVEKPASTPRKTDDPGETIRGIVQGQYKLFE